MFEEQTAFWSFEPVRHEDDAPTKVAQGIRIAMVQSFHDCLMTRWMHDERTTLRIHEVKRAGVGVLPIGAGFLSHNEFVNTGIALIVTVVIMDTHVGHCHYREDLTLCYSDHTIVHLIVAILHLKAMPVYAQY